MKGNLVDLGALLGEPERAARIWRTFARRLSQVSVHIPMDQRKTALYCSVFDGVIYGGTTGTSYADLLAAAGLVDVAAERFQDWPRYDMEDLLALNPQVIVIPFGRAADLAALPGADRLRAFGVDGQVIELPKSWAQEAGPFLVDVAELLCDRVYGAPVHLLDKVPSE
jgi:ABC-type Fe3+-hydroxamate transport system substrate-binding protein